MELWLLFTFSALAGVLGQHASDGRRELSHYCAIKVEEAQDPHWATVDIWVVRGSSLLLCEGERQG